MQEIYRQAIQDKNRNAYMIIVTGESTDYMEANLYTLNKKNDELVIGKNSVGLCLLERKSRDVYETLYSVDEKFQGRGLGAALIEFSKTLSLKFGAQKIEIIKMERKVKSPIIEEFYYDANLCLYLNHGFKFVLRDCYQHVLMICDLVEETSLDSVELMKLRLKNKSEAFKILT